MIAAARAIRGAGVVVVIGSEVRYGRTPCGFEQVRHQRSFAVYVAGWTKQGLPQLFEFFLRYARVRRVGSTLVLIGTPCSTYRRTHGSGSLILSDMTIRARLPPICLIMPVLRNSVGWRRSLALGRPVLANGRCEVLKGQAFEATPGCSTIPRGIVEARWVIAENALLAERSA